MVADGLWPMVLVGCILPSSMDLWAIVQLTRGTPRQIRLSIPVYRAFTQGPNESCKHSFHCPRAVTEELNTCHGCARTCADHTRWHAEAPDVASHAHGTCERRQQIVAPDHVAIPWRTVLSATPPTVYASTWYSASSGAGM